MEISEFEGWLKKGLGRAILFLQNNEATPYRDVILHACTHDVRHDRQCEMSRAAYLYDIICLTSDREFYRERILSALQWPDEEQADYQMFELALRFAQDGDGAAKRVMYTTFAKNAAKGDFTGAEELVRLDGFDGFLYAVERLSPIDLEEDGWQVESWIEVLEERYGKEEAWQKLESMAVSMSEIAPLLEYVRQTREERKRRRKPGDTRVYPDYASLKQSIAENPRRVRGSLHGWGRRASEPELAQAADDLLTEEDEERLCAYLHLF